MLVLCFDQKYVCMYVCGKLPVIMAFFPAQMRVVPTSFTDGGNSTLFASTTGIGGPTIKETQTKDNNVSLKAHLDEKQILILLVCPYFGYWLDNGNYR